MTALRTILTYAIYYLCFLIPRKKNLWLYSSLNGKFLDNSKYFFLYANEHCKNVRHVWISNSDDTVSFLRSKNFEAYHSESKQAKKLSLKAGAFIYSSYINTICNAAFAGGAFRFNLWHGIPLKKIEHDIYHGPIRYLYNPANLKERWKRFCTSPALIRKNDAVLATSEELKKNFASAFRLSEDKIVVGQYPRLMPFNWSKEELMKYIESIESFDMLNAVETFSKFNEVIVYMPTWRDGNINFIEESIPDFDLLDNICRQQNILFVFKVHINTVFNKDLNNFSNLLLLNNNLDIYPVLPFTTTLLTDYSSIFFDYAILNKRIIFYPFDLTNYQQQNRELYFDYATITKDEIVVHTFKELLDAISNKTQKTSAHSFQKYLNISFDYEPEINFVKQKVGIESDAS